MEAELYSQEMVFGATLTEPSIGFLPTVLVHEKNKKVNTILKNSFMLLS